MVTRTGDFLKRQFRKGVDVVSEKVTDEISYRADLILDKAEYRLERIQRNLLKNLFSLLLIGAGAILIFISLYFFLTDFAGLADAYALLIFGGFLLIMGIISKMIKGGDRRW